MLHAKAAFQKCSLIYLTAFDSKSFGKALWEFSCDNTTRDALRDLVPLAQCKKREMHQWSSVTFSKVAGFTLQIY